MSGTFNYDRAGVCQDQNTTYENQSEAQRNFQDAVFGDYCLLYTSDAADD